MPESRKSVRHQGRISCASNDKAIERSWRQQAYKLFYPDGMHGQKVEERREYQREPESLMVVVEPVKQRRNFRRWRAVSALAIADRFDGVCVHPER